MNKQFEFINREITDSETTTNYYSEGRTKTGWETFANGQKTSGFWRSMEKTQHSNILEMKGIYLSLLTFTKEAKNATAPFR